MHNVIVITIYFIISQASDLPTQQLVPPTAVQAQTVPQGAQTVVQPLQTLYQPLQAVLHPQQTILPPSQPMPQPPQTVPHPPHARQPQQAPQVLLQPPHTVIQPPPAILQPPQAVLQHPSVLVPQPPKPGFSENNPPPSSFVQFSAFPNTFSSPVLNSALQAPVQQAVPTSLANTNSQTSTMSLLNALHDEKLGLLLPVIVRMEHKMDQLMAMIGQMGSQLNSIIMGNQSNVSMTGRHTNTVIMGSQSNAPVMGNRSNVATVGSQPNAVVMENQSNAEVVRNQSNVAITGSQSDGTTAGNQPNTAMVGSQSNVTVVGTQNSTALNIDDPVYSHLGSNNNVGLAPSNARQANSVNTETQAISTTDGPQLNVPSNETSSVLNESPTHIQTRSQRNKDQRNNERVVTGSLNLPAFYMSKEYLAALKTKSTSAKNFAVRLMRELFTKVELEGKNISGSRGKDQVDPERIKTIKELVFKMYNTLPEDMDLEWRNCRKAMDSFLRSKNFRHRELGEQRAQQNAELLNSLSMATLNREQTGE